MRYKVVLTDFVRSQLSHYSPALKLKLREALDKLSEAPYSGKPLKDELEGFWRYRVLRYRILYKVDGKRIEVLVLGIGRRDGVYDWFLKWVAENEKA